MDAGLASLHKKRPNVCVLNVDIRDWSSPVAKQYEIQSVPFLVLFDDKGKPLGVGDEALEALAKVLRR